MRRSRRLRMVGVMLMAAGLLWAAAIGLAKPSGFTAGAIDSKLPSSSKADQPAVALRQPHPLPALLAETCGAVTLATSDRGQSEVSAPAQTYFDAVRPATVGYLLWTAFPVALYVEPLTEAHPDVISRWQTAVATAVRDWRQYFPLVVTPDAESADIRLRPVIPPLRYSADGGFRAQSGEARYEIYVRAQEIAPVLAHRFEVKVKPGQAPHQLEATLRHELGHALGLWGHSRNPEDALYYSQVSAPPPVSQRDVATLCQVYRQPTALGWPPPAGGVEGLLNRP